MKKLFGILLSLALTLCLALSLFSCSCADNGDGGNDTTPPVTDGPGTDDPGTDDPGTDDPGTDDPGTDDPGTDGPGTSDCTDHVDADDDGICDNEGCDTPFCDGHFDNDLDGVCDVPGCNETVEPPCEHNIITSTFEGDCTNDAYTLDECTLCDYERIYNVERAPGHTGSTYCTVCGEPILPEDDFKG